MSLLDLSWLNLFWLDQHWLEVFKLHLSRPYLSLTALSWLDLSLIDMSWLDCLDLTCLDLTCLDLTCLDLTCLDLTYLVLTCPDLTCPDLTWPDLTFPSLAWPYLTFAGLTCPDFISHNLTFQTPFNPLQTPYIDACRSTITQQEAELKRLHETLDIRNKKIMQLESQVGSAASYLSSRDTGHQSNISPNICDQLTALLTTMNLVLSKLVPSTDSRSSPINIYNSPCQVPKLTMIDMGTQTDKVDIISADMTMTTITRETVADDTEAGLSCTLCGKVLESIAQLDLHIVTTAVVPPYQKCPALIETQVVITVVRNSRLWNFFSITML